jgi:ketosteroid isomerase-like protein
MIKIIIKTLFLFSFSIFTHANTDIDKTLNSFHQAASKANLKQYFSLLTDNAVFLGTDATERWTKKEFENFVEPYFSKGHGWTYKTIERHITLNKDNKSAFFDELLENKNYGLCRSSGLLYKTSAGWKIAQYNLSVPLPNEIAKTIVKHIKQYQQSNNPQTKLVKNKDNKHDSE